jgi:hypothetical protein
MMRTPRCPQKGGRHGSRVSAGRRIGRAQEAHRRVRPSHRRWSHRQTEGALRHDDGGADAPGDMDDRAPGDPRGHGIDGRVLEASLACAGARFPVDLGQRATRQSRPWSQVRYERRRVAGRTPRAGIDPRQLRPAGRDSGVTGVDSHTEADVPNVGQAGTPDSKGTRGGERQVIQRGQRHPGQGEPRDSRSDHRRRDGSRSPGRISQRSDIYFTH